MTPSPFTVTPFPFTAQLPKAARKATCPPFQKEMSLTLSAVHPTRSTQKMTPSPFTVQLPKAAQKVTCPLSRRLMMSQKQLYGGRLAF